MAEVVVGTGKGGRLRRIPWRTVLLVVGVIVVAGGAGAGLRWWQHRDADRTAKVADPLGVSLNDAQNMSLSDNPKGAHETINKSLSKAGLSAVDKYRLYMTEGVVYENEKDYANALSSYRKADDAQPTFDSSQCVGRMALQVGDKALAIKYYKKAITLVPPEDPLAESYKKSYSNIVADLESGQ